MVTVQGYAPPAEAEFFESTGLLCSSGQEQTRRLIHEAEDFVVFSPNSYKFDESIHCPLRKGERVETPCAVSLFPKNIDRPPRELGERVYNLQRWTEMPRGGHFPAHEEPELLVADIRTFFRSLR